MMNIRVFFCCFSISVLFFCACSASNRPMSDQVAAAAVKSSRHVILTWEAPTTNTDGSPLTDLAGYNVYYGLVEDERGKMEMKQLYLKNGEPSCKKIDSGEEEKLRTECTYTVQDLSRALHYFKVTAFNKEGRESDFSNEIKK